MAPSASEDFSTAKCNAAFALPGIEVEIDAVAYRPA